jgi:hypothetical protein
MKKTSVNIVNAIIILFMAGVVFTQSSCKKDSIAKGTGTPVITGLRAYKPAPRDSVLSETGPGAYVVLQGSHLTGITAVYFDGVKANINTALGSDNNFPVTVPAIIPFASVPADQLNTIVVVTSTGKVTYKFPIVAPAPTISSISDESASPGDSVRIYGLNFFFVQSVTYAGLPVTSYSSSNDGTYVSLAVPAGATQTGGIVSVTTKSGSASTLYTVHDFVTGVLNNYDNVNNLSWGSGTSNSSLTYPGNNGFYGILNASNIPAGDGSWWNGGRSINTNAVQWVPQANLADAVSQYALKFEISVTTPWSNGSIQIVKDYSWTYSALYRPWKNSDGSTTAFTTKGWRTVTIPLTNFVDSNGLPPASLTDLLSSSGNGAINVVFINDGSSTVTAFEAAIDNIRVVKVN